MSACKADAYRVLDEWRMEGQERSLYIRYLTALEGSISKAQAEVMKSKSKG